MLVRVGIFVRDATLRQRVRRALSSERDDADPRMASVVIHEAERGGIGSGVVAPAGGFADLLERLRSDSQDLVLIDGIPRSATHEDESEPTSDPSLPERPRGPDPADARRLVDALLALPERPGLILLHPEDDPRAHAALLAAGCVAVLWTGLSDAGLSEALVTLFERRRNESLTRLLAARPQRPEPEPMISVSAAIQRLLATARRVAVADTPVLLLGETGVGKERIAHLLHAWSPRGRGPFVAVNCAAIPSELFESELFGHERGAFTGAARARRGHFELAHGGTLFLDEIGEVPMALQAKLLRVLQDRRIRPLGSDRELTVDVRVVAATNRDLRSDMQAGSFRRDLYYRLGVVELEVPPLRERPEDVRELAERYALHFAARLGRAVARIEPDALAALERYDWPGNVRELVNVIERSVLLCLGQSITLADLPAAIARPEFLRSVAAEPVARERRAEPAGPGPHGAEPGSDSGPESSKRAEARSLLRASGPSEAGPLASSDPSPASVDEPSRAGASDPAIEPEPILQLPEEWLRQPWKLVREQLLLAGERAYLIGLLRASQGRIGASARRAGIAERSLFEKMKRHGLRKEDFRDPQG